MTNASKTLLPATHGPKGTSEISFGKQLISPTMLLAAWIPLIAVTAFHYATSHEQHHVHDILRRLYYLPIVVGALQMGIRGGILCAFMVTVAYFPHAFFLPHHFDPAAGIEKVLEITIYFLVGTIAGYLSDKEKKHRRQLEQSLHTQETLKAQLVRAGRLSALGQTVAGIAHEIKNPLHSLLGTTEVVDQVIPEDCEERRLWEIHISEIERLKTISERFLSFARPTPIQLQELDLRDVAQRVNELYGAQARQNNIQLESRLPNTAVKARGDKDQLAQIGINIFLNAQKAIGNAGGTIRISVGKENRNNCDMAFLSIENTGPEVDTTHIEELFDPFYSGTDSTGLGLSISSRIAQQHDGFIDVQNKGLGVAFTVYIHAL
ncbi:MAG: DUF4118 domain-containing protein [Deltaproteobacteria bacterium]|nr:DUF4118 domain-containing protein [Deltaproteobacteria bacterium]MBN2671731.1 DUF4118 domain-containing protein [Deltaproteobacteria bacterium]